MFQLPLGPAVMAVLALVIFLLLAQLVARAEPVVRLELLMEVG